MSRYEGSPAVLIERRKGTPDSPFSNMNENLVVAQDGKVVLSEIPNELNRVIVTSVPAKTWYEIKNSEELTENAFKVDYINKIVTFHISHAGKQLNFRYTGEGNHYYSPHSIYTKLEDGNVAETLGDLVEGGRDAMDALDTLNDRLDEINTARDNTISATNDARNVISQGNQVIANANDRIGAMNGKITEATNKISEINGIIEDAEETLDDINQELATVTNITNNGQTVINNAETLINNVRSIGEFNLSTQYRKNNIVSYNGSSYMALQDTRNNTLPVLPVKENANWRLLVLKGDKGDKGDTGAALSIQGSLTNISQLPATGLAGQAYTVNGELYVWSSNTNQWENVGYIKGEKGDKGDTGDDGISAYQVAVNDGFTGTESEWLLSLKGDKGEDAHFDINDIPNATTTQKGLMTTTQVTKLNGISTGANYTEVIDNLTSTSTTSAVSANKAKELSDKIDILTGDVGTNTSTITTLNNTINSHKDKIASTTELGHVKVDGTTVTIDENGVISSVGGSSTSKIYGVKIDTTNSNPETALTYTDDAIGFTPASGNNGVFSYGSWQDKFPFNQIKPCLYNNGSVVNYLNPNDYTKFANGSDADITSGSAGDVMIEFPKIYWKFETVGNDLYIRYSDARVDNSYKPLAHTRGETQKDFVYISAYMGNTISSKLRSLSGKTPTVNQTIGTFRTQAKANGANYDQMAYYQLLMLQVLFVVMFKSRDSQTALGRGYVDGNSESISTGGTNTKGLFYGENTGKLQNKFCGIEDFWGNIYYWIDGIFSDANRNILIGNQNFNDTGSGYANYGQGATANMSGYIGSIQGGTESGFIVKTATGSATTHYADYGYLYASCLPSFGGSWALASNAGAFRLSVSYSASDAYSSIGARLLAL